MPKFITSIVDLWLDGYDSEEEMEDDCVEFIKDQLDFCASYVQANPFDEEKLETLLLEAVDTDGAHHKQWYLEQIAEMFGITLQKHEEGIAP